MKFEKLKTIILTALVAISLLLTYLLWTFQPNYEQLANLETIEKVMLAQERSLNDVITPIHVFHHAEESHQGAYRVDGFKPLYDLLLEGTFTSFEQYSLNNQVMNLVNTTKSIDFVFADGLSMDVFHQLLDFSRERPVLSHVDRIIVFEQDRGDRVKTYAWFVSFQNKSYIEAEISNQTFQAYEDIYAQQKESFLDVELLHVGSSRLPTYFPTKPLEMKKLQAYPVPIPELDLTKALFPDPSLVRESYQEDNLRSYTDGNRELKVFFNSNYVTFINPTRRGDRMDGQADSPILQAQRFVNSHGGFTEPYAFTSIRERADHKSQIEFRLLFNGYPAFDARIAELQVIWQDHEVFEYVRSMETIADSVIYEEPETLTLLSADELMTALQNSFVYDANEIEKTTLGYTVSSYDDYVVFTPNWYIFYQGKWEVILKENEPMKGGNARGLEPDKNDLHRHVFRA